MTVDAATFHTRATLAEQANREHAAAARAAARRETRAELERELQTARDRDAFTEATAAINAGRERGLTEAARITGTTPTQAATAAQRLAQQRGATRDARENQAVDKWLAARTHE